MGMSSQLPVLEKVRGKSCSEQRRKITQGFRCKINFEIDII